MVRGGRDLSWSPRADHPPAGHINHSLFWTNLAPSSSEGKGNGGVLKDGPLKEAITSVFGSFEDFKKQFNTTTAGIQGSGWGWLVRPVFLGAPMGAI